MPKVVRHSGAGVMGTGVGVPWHPSLDTRLVNPAGLAQGPRALHPQTLDQVPREVAVFREARRLQSKACIWGAPGLPRCNTFMIL